MKNKAIIFAILGIALLITDCFLVARYYSWDIPVTELFPYACFLVFAELVILWSCWHYETLINPFAIYSFFIYTAGFSFITLASKQQATSQLFVYLILLSIFCFLMGGIISTYTSRFSLESVIPKLTPRLSLQFLYFVFVIGILVFIMEIRQLGYLPVLNLSAVSVYKDLNENNVTPLHNFVVLNAVLPAMFYVWYKEKKIPLYVYLLVMLVSIFILLNFFSRQMIILLLFSMLLAVNYFHRIPVVRLIAAGVISVVIFILLGELRDSSTDKVSAGAINEVIKGYTGITKPTGILETYLSLYGAVNFSTAEMLTTLSVHDNYYTWGLHTFRPVITLLPVDKAALYPEAYSSYSLLGTYLVDPFMDFRWAGVVILNFLYGFLSVNSFKNYLNKKSPYYIVEWSLFMFCIFMCSFTNFFHMFFVVFFFAINRLAIK